jgi:hypothetical protein
MDFKAAIFNLIPAGCTISSDSAHKPQSDLFLSTVSAHLPVLGSKYFRRFPNRTLFLVLIFRGMVSQKSLQAILSSRLRNWIVLWNNLFSVHSAYQLF